MIRRIACWFNIVIHYLHDDEDLPYWMIPIHQLCVSLATYAFIYVLNIGD